MSKGNRLEAALLVRVSGETAALLEDVASRLPMSRASIAREAIKRGLKEIAQNPACLLIPEEPPDQSAPFVDVVPEHEAVPENGSTPRKPRRRK